MYLNVIIIINFCYFQNYPDYFILLLPLRLLQNLKIIQPDLKKIINIIFPLQLHLNCKSINFV